jgi:tetratricopeptide (TPR) repeat protein
MADLRTAIRLDPNDPAAQFETSHKEPLTAAAIQHGEEQVQRMLADRPTMARFGEKARVLYEWAARKFAGENLGQRVFWDGSEPVRFDSDNTPPSAERPGRIRVRRTYTEGANKGESRSFEVLWGAAVFELYNISSARDFQRFELEVTTGKLTKAAFATKMIECESRAAEKARAFYVHVFLPWASEQRVPTDPNLWYVAIRSNSGENLLLPHIDKRNEWWRYYEGLYDSIVLNSLVITGENDKVIELASKMQKQAMANQKGENADVYIHRGRAYANKGDLGKAIVDYNEAIRLNPRSAYAHHCRGVAYERMREYGKEIADEDEVIRLDPQYAIAYCARGLAYGAMRQYDKEIADESEAIRFDPRNAIAYCDRGCAYMQMAHFEKAIADFSEAIRLDPKDAEAYANRGWIYAHLGETRKADADYSEAKRLGCQEGRK